MFKNVEKQSWTAVSHSAQILFWHVTTNKAGKCPDFLRKISSVFTLKMLNCPLQQRSLTLQRSCFFFFFLAGSVGTKHGWKLSVSSQEDSVVSCFEMLKHLVEQWSLAQRRSCFCSLYSVATKCDWKMSHCCKNGRVVSHVLNNGLSLCSCQKSKIPEDEERF